MFIHGSHIDKKIIMDLLHVGKYALDITAIQTLHIRQVEPEMALTSC